MSERVTLKDLNRLVTRINEEAERLGLLEGEPADQYYMKDVHPHIGLDFGSKTFGKVWALYATGGTVYGSGRYEWGMGSLGATKPQALASLRWYLCGLRESQKKSENPNYQGGSNA